MKKQIWLTVVLVAFLVSVLMLGSYVTSRSVEARLNAERRFVKEKEVPSARSYDRVMSMNPDISYPSSPEGVMDFFNEAFYLMYSNAILDDGTLFEVMVRQRDVYSDELKLLNPVDMQFAQLKNDLESLYDEDNICLSVERKGTVYDDNYPGECVVQTMIFYNTFGAIYRNYFMIQDSDGYWRINAWRDTDENYAIMQ